MEPSPDRFSLNIRGSEHEYDWDVTYDPLQLPPTKSSLFNPVVYPGLNRSTTVGNPCPDSALKNVMRGECQQGPTGDETWWWSTVYAGPHKYLGFPTSPTATRRRRFHGIFNPSPPAAAVQSQAKATSISENEDCGDIGGGGSSALTPPFGTILASGSQISLATESNSSGATEYFSLRDQDFESEEDPWENEKLDNESLSESKLVEEWEDDTAPGYARDCQYRDMNGFLYSEENSEGETFEEKIPTLIYMSTPAVTPLLACASSSHSTLGKSEVNNSHSVQFIYKYEPFHKEKFSDNEFEPHESKTNANIVVMADKNTSTLTLQCENEYEMTKETLDKLDEIILKSKAELRELELNGKPDMVDRAILTVPIIPLRVDQETSTATLISLSDAQIQTTSENEEPLEPISEFPSGLNHSTPTDENVMRISGREESANRKGNTPLDSPEFRGVRTPRFDEVPTATPDQRITGIPKPTNRLYATAFRIEN